MMSNRWPLNPYNFLTEHSDWYTWQRMEEERRLRESKAYPTWSHEPYRDHGSMLSSRMRVTMNAKTDNLRYSLEELKDIYRERRPPIRNQGKRGSSVAHACAYAQEYTMALAAEADEVKPLYWKVSNPRRTSWAEEEFKAEHQQDPTPLWEPNHLDDAPEYAVQLAEHLDVHKHLKEQEQQRKESPNHGGLVGSVEMLSGTKTGRTSTGRTQGNVCKSCGAVQP